MPDPSDAKADLFTDPDPDDISPEETDGTSSQTKDPGLFGDIDPDDLVTPEPTVTVTVSPQPASGDDGSGGVGTMIPWILVVLLLAAVVALAVKAFGRRHPTAPVPVLAPITASVPVVPDPAASPVVPELVTLADLITTPAAQTQVVRALRTVGVEPVEVTVGAPFNPEVHEAVATRPAESSDQVGTIAVVHRAGWRSVHGVVRPAGV
ncbi:MAG: nucleotide exchange factor GrpE, partial [Cellulomonas sp.]|nr:nucleotide exchange factor GrpE [Cellulomonas sp.]